MHILVTGGVGVVGRAVVAWLVAKGYRVRVIDRKPAALAPGAEFQPCDITDAYSFSKEIAEGIGVYFWHREGISSVALRLPAVVSAGSGSRLVLRSQKTARLVDRLLALSQAERGRWLSERMDAFNMVRSQRLLESPEIYYQFFTDNSIGPASNPGSWQICSTPMGKTFRRPRVGIESLVSIECAQRLIGFEPEHTLSEL